MPTDGDPVPSWNSSFFNRHVSLRDALALARPGLVQCRSFPKILETHTRNAAKLQVLVGKAILSVLDKKTYVRVYLTVASLYRTCKSL